MTCVICHMSSVTFGIYNLLLNESVSDGGVCRTAPATPGLLNKSDKVVGQVGGGSVINRATISSFVILNIVDIIAPYNITFVIPI